MRACPLFLKDFYSFPSTGCSTFFFQSSQFFECCLAHCRHLSVDSENYFVIFQGKMNFLSVWPFKFVQRCCIRYICCCLGVFKCILRMESSRNFFTMSFRNRCCFYNSFLSPQSQLLLYFYKHEKTVSDNFHDTITCEFICQFWLYMRLETCLYNINVNLSYAAVLKLVLIMYYQSTFIVSFTGVFSAFLIKAQV